MPILPVFYTSLLIISIGGQSGILVKKFIEHKKDKAQIGPIIKNAETEENKRNINNQHWNSHLCDHIGYFLLLLTMVLVCFSYIILNKFIFVNSNLNDNQKMQLMTCLHMIITKIVWPVGIYVKNDKIFKYLKTEFN